MQIELPPALSRDKEGMEKICNVIRTRFRLGGTLINMDLLSRR